MSSLTCDILARIPSQPPCYVDHRGRCNFGYLVRITRNVIIYDIWEVTTRKWRKLTRIYGKYIDVDMRRALETVKGGVSVQVTVQRLKISKTNFMRRLFANLSLSIASVSHREHLGQPEEVKTILSNICYIWKKCFANIMKRIFYLMITWHTILFCICLFQFSTYFEHSSAHHKEIHLYQYDIWYMSLYVGDIYQISYWYKLISLWWALECSKHVENWYKHI